MSKQYHIAQSGKNAGQLVPCYAKNCTIGNFSPAAVYGDADAINPENKVDFYNLAAEYTNSNNTAKHIAVASDPRSSARMLDAIAHNTKDEYALYLVAKHPNTSAETLNALARVQEVYVHQGIAENFNCPENLLTQLEDYQDDSIVRERARRTRFIRENPTSALAVSLNPNSTASELDAVKDTPDGLDDSVRNYVAHHPNTSPETLRYLADKTMGSWGTSSNPNTPKDVLLKLAKHPQANVRTNVYYNPALSTEERQSIKYKHDPDTIGYISPNYYKALEARRKLIQKTI